MQLNSIYAFEKVRKMNSKGHSSGMVASFGVYEHWKKNINILMALCVLITMGCVEKPFKSNKTDVPTISPDSNLSDDAIKEKIISNLNGTTIVYHDIAGRPVIYNVTERDIRNIAKTNMGDKPAWRVRIGEGLAWDFYYDEFGNEVIKKEQLFRT